MHHDNCPRCGREFKSILDYPRVLVLSFAYLPIPEAVDRFSDAAAEKRLARRRSNKRDDRIVDEGINRTPEIARACAKTEVQDYFTRLVQLAGQIVAPSEIKPPFKPAEYFKWAHAIPRTKLFMALAEEEPEDVIDGIAHVEVYCDGPNLGSAGGPTLLPLGSIGRLHYQGLLL